MHTELSILSAESYDDGLRFRPARLGAGATARGTSRQQDSGNGQPARKRNKAQASGNEIDDEEKKRSRGRPRLDTKDETAADRRRTQIRLAQRAYRNRKETAIQTLEKKVQELRENNEEMSTAFTHLLDIAVSHGVLDAAPEFGRQLMATTEKFLSLARRSSEDGAGAKEDGRSSPHRASVQSSGSPEPEDGSKEDGSNESSRSPEAAVADLGARRNPGTQLYGGIMMTEEPEEEAFEMSANGSASFGLPPSGLTPSALGYEIITQPTLDNASFPFLAQDFTDLDTFLDSVPMTTSDSAPAMTVAATTVGGSTALTTFAPPSPYASLRVPSSYSYQERTFGRRLQRAALEQGLALIQMDNPPPHLYAAIFGFCLLFESREKIVDRLQGALRMTSRDSLHNWKHPFLHLNGAGTFFEDLQAAAAATGGSGGDEASGRSPGSGAAPTAVTVTGSKMLPVGNQGTIQHYRPADAHANFAMGPWSAAVEEARDERMDDRMRISVPDFQGEFFDTDEVEYYLRERDVVIPQGADFIQAVVDVSRFADDAVTSTTATATSLDGMGSPTGTGTGVGTAPQAAGASNGGGASDFGFGAGASVINGLLNPSMQDMWSAAVTSSSERTTTAAVMDPIFSSEAFSSAGATPTVSSLDAGSLLSYAPSPRASVTTASTGSTMRHVTVNVEKLVRELVSRAVCLGRSPGIRPKDVNTAFWAAVTVS